MLLHNWMVYVLSYSGFVLSTARAVKIFWAETRPVATQSRERTCILAALYTPGSQREVGTGRSGLLPFFPARCSEADWGMSWDDLGFLVDGLGYKANIGLSTISETDGLGRRASELVVSATRGN